MKISSKVAVAGILGVMIGIAWGMKAGVARGAIDELSAPITYQDSMIILSSEQGVAAIVFTDEIKDGVNYRYRYLPEDGKVEAGEGKVFEKYRRVPGDKPGETGAIDEGGVLFLKAGPIEVKWSYGSKGKGYLYYRPESVHVQIVHARNFEKIDLKRFAFSGPTEEQKPKNADSTAEVKPDTKEGSLEVHYHRFVLLKHEGKIIAIHILPDPASGWDGIHYRWYQLADGSDRFYKPSPDEADSSPNPAVTSGSGETHEENGEGIIEAGAIRIPWSKGNQQLGWLYLLKAAGEIEVYPLQFERLEDCSGKLDSSRWIKLKK